MANEEVSIDFSANVAPFTQSLNQAVSSLAQFSAGADGALGKIAKLNAISIKFVTATSGLTGANKTAAAQAAAYQQKLASIEATTKTTGKQYENLSKITMKFARDFPIGMDKAIETTRQLQKTGVTTTKDIEKLGKAFINLQAATGEWNPSIAEDMIQITRTFGNSTSQIESFNDSLTTTTQKFGASATSVIAFSKGIAPVASVIGLGETSVIGLSTAMSTLGEDGYRAGNAVNKILLDMGRSIRTGSPEMKNYAAVIGTTTDNLKAMFEADPTEAVIRFSEAIKKQGTSAINTLDTLGFQGVNDFKAISALAKTDVRGAIETAQSGYGNKSSSEAAKEALGGVNDQVAMMGETMSQTVAAAGKPFIGALGQIVTVANSVAKAINGIVNNRVVQFFGALAIGATALLKTLTLLQAFSTAKLISGPIMAGYRAGQAAGAAGTAVSRAMAVEQLGTQRGGLGYAIGARSGLLPGATIRQRIANAALYGSNFAGTAAAGLVNMQTNLLRINPEDPYNRTTTGASFARNLKAARVGETMMGAKQYADAELKTAGSTTAGLAGMQRVPIKEQFQNMGAALKQFGKDLGGTGAGMESLKLASKTLALNFLSAGKTMVVSMARSMASLVTSMLPMIAVMGGVMLAMKAFSSWKDNRERGGSVEGFKDANKNYNNFAESAGLATRSLVSLAEAAKITTSTLNKKNVTEEDALKISAEELANTQNPNYKNAMGDISDKESATGLAGRIRSLVGENNPEALAQAMSDVADKRGIDFQKQVAKAYKENAGKSSYETGLNAVESSFGNNWWGGGTGHSTERSQNTMSNVQGELARNIQSLVDVYGEGARGTATQSEAEKFLAAAQKSNLDVYSKEVTSTLKELGYDVGGDKESGYRLIREGKEVSPVNGDNLKYTSQETAAYRAARETEQRMATAKGGASYAGGRDEIGRASTGAKTLADALNAAEKAALNNGKVVTDLTAGMKGMEDPLTKSVVELAKAPNSISAQTKAGEEYAKVFRGNNKSVAETLANLRAQLANMAESDYRRGGIISAINQVQLSDYTSAGQTRNERNAATVAAARMTIANGPGDTQESLQAYTDAQAAIKDVNDQGLSFFKQFVEAKHNLDIQSQRQSEAAGRQAFRTQRDFNIQVKQSQEDFILARKRQAEDLAKTIFNPFERISVVRTADAYSTNSNLKSQNNVLRKQMDNIKKLKKLGLTQAAIDTLDLMNPANAQQTDRLLLDMQQNQGLVSETNKNVKERQKLTSQYANSDDNVANRRAMEDFEKQMKRGRSAMKRGLNDMYADLAISKKQALEDLARMGDEISVVGENWQDNLNNAISDIPNGPVKNKLIKNITSMVDSMSIEFDKSFGGKFGKWGIKASDLGKDWAVAPHAATSSDNPVHGESTTDGGAWGGKGGTIGIVPLKHQLGSGHISKYATGGKGRYSAGWKQKGDWLDGYHHGQDIAAPSGTPIQSTVLGKIDHIGGNGPESGWAGNYVQMEMFNGKKIMFAHMSSVDGSLKHEFEKNKKDGKETVVNRGDQIGRVGSTGRSTGPHVHIEVRNKPYGDHNAEDPRKYMATGGIVNQATKAVIGEAGAEAVIPLNPRGAAVLADAMVRYVNSSDVLASRVQPYATATHSYSHNQYDHSTQINGPITVESNDPAEFARKMQMRQRRQRLMQPIGN